MWIEKQKYFTSRSFIYNLSKLCRTQFAYTFHIFKENLISRQYTLCKNIQIESSTNEVH